jgi:long-chain acyl-CoA synthetase
MTETSPLVTLNPMDGIRKAGSVGMPLPDTEVKLVDIETGTREVPVGDPGELIVRGPQVMKGYWNKPEETAKALRNGWLYTGDIAIMDEDGYFYIVDRKKDMIDVSGFKVFPREVDDVLYEHPAVAMAAVVGVSDPRRPGSELVKAYIVVKPDYAGKVTADDIKAYCKQRLAPYKVPTIIEFREELPTTLIGKVFKRALREEEKEKLKKERA